jgi:hypothetical protein
MTSNEFLEKRWLPPIGAPKAMYYPLFGGYQAPSLPIIFENPTAALTWAISRFKRDGICNAWAGHELPPWLRHVGVIYCRSEDLTPCPMPYLQRFSKLESEYFSEVKFFQCAPGFSLDYKSQYIKADDAVFSSCIATLHAFQDYQMSK